MNRIANIQSDMPALPLVTEVSFEDLAEELLGNSHFCDVLWFLLDPSNNPSPSMAVTA